MTLPTALTDFCRANGYGGIRRTTPLGGGCVNNASRLDTDSGPLFVKLNPGAPPDMFEREAEGLAALSVPGGPRVPRVLCVGAGFIVQEYLHPAPRPHNFWESFGAQMAALHNVTAPRFGFAHDNYIGLTPQINIWADDGCTFFAEHRLRFQADLARRNRYIDSTDLRQIDSLVSHLSSLIPPQPASLLHGDLWGGNIHTGPQGEPALIDPATHYGWAEADLAMMTLFGSPPDSFFRAYASASARPLAPGYRERFDLYNLYHLLNHLNLFGEGYAGVVHSILRRYV
ncbi:MAG: fructosamine kinase family protein [Chloroflexi bacterium]|nr:fructosamine kinase family protein [Chloroflexota bacterium]